MESINVLILGSGGREHALAWKIKQSPRCGSLFIAPGNAGSKDLGIQVALSLQDFEAIGRLVLEHHISLVIVGPEEPLVKGIADYFATDPNLSRVTMVGPGAKGARLEGSKAYAKEFMARHAIPTATYARFTLETLEEGWLHLSESRGPYVLKADGLAAGKGVVILQELMEAKATLEDMLRGQFGAASQCVVVEQFLNGTEFSVFILTDGRNYVLLPEAKDYKRVGEGDRGPNTGGMGAVSPVPLFDPTMSEKVRRRIIEPTLRGLEQDGIPYQGFLFFGLISVAGNPLVIEYNCRLGDPETEAILPRLETDLLDWFSDLAQGCLGKHPTRIVEKYAVSTVLVSGGYPGDYQQGFPVDLPQVFGEGICFHAGTAWDAKGQVITSGGRVLVVTALDEDMSLAAAKSREMANAISFQGKYYRCDIGHDLMDLNPIGNLTS